MVFEGDERRRGKTGGCLQDAEAKDDNDSDLRLLRHLHIPEHRNRYKCLQPSANMALLPMSRLEPT